MSEFAPVEHKDDMALVHDDEIISGYWSGYHGEPAPGSDKSRAFWHGWRNGMTDSGRAELDEAQQRLVRSILGCRVRTN